MTKDDPEIKEKKSAWSQHPDYRIDIEVCKQPVRVMFSGVTIADSRRSLLLTEQNHAPVYYFPRQDVRMDLLHASEKTSFCPFKSEARHWSLRVGDRHIAVAAWSYEDPFEEVKQIKDHIAFYPEVVEQLDK